MNRLIRRGHPDDYDDDGRYQPRPYHLAASPRPTCQPGCCGIGPRLCEEGDTND